MINLLDYAIQHCGVPYRWAGNNPLTGFDCSGFVQWLLRSVGLDPPGRQTSQTLYDHFEATSERNSFTLGALAFYGKSVREVAHVAMLLDEYQVVEAGGGDHLTLTLEDAAAKDACVRIVLLNGRPDLVAILKPRYGTIGCI